jgi:hypothetical protein
MNLIPKSIDLRLFRPAFAAVNSNLKKGKPVKPSDGILRKKTPGLALCKGREF